MEPVALNIKILTFLHTDSVITCFVCLLGIGTKIVEKNSELERGYLTFIFFHCNDAILGVHCNPHSLLFMSQVSDIFNSNNLVLTLVFVKCPLHMSGQEIHLSWTRFLALLFLIFSFSCSNSPSSPSSAINSLFSWESLYHPRLMPRALSFHTIHHELLQSPLQLQHRKCDTLDFLRYRTGVPITRIREMKG